MCKPLKVGAYKGIRNCKSSAIRLIQENAWVQHPHTSVLGVKRHITSVENMLLAATAENLGSCIYTTFDDEEEAKLKDILEAPQKYRIATIIQLGYAEGVLVVPQRKRLNEIVSYQHF